MINHNANYDGEVSLYSEEIPSVIATNKPKLEVLPEDNIECKITEYLLIKL